MVDGSTENIYKKATWFLILIFVCFSEVLF